MIDTTKKQMVLIQENGLKQVIISPRCVSGDYIQLGNYYGDQLYGWRRIDGLNVVHIVKEVEGE